MGRINKTQLLIGKIINGVEILKEIDYGKVSVRCVKCGHVSPRYLANIKKGPTICRGCKPTKADIYLNDVRDLYLANYTPVEIRKALGCSNAVVHALLRVLVQSGEIARVEDNYEYSFKEIAEGLGISYEQARAAYDSGMRKLRGSILNNTEIALDTEEYDSTF